MNHQNPLPRKANFHQPVLLTEVLELLQVKKGAKYLDATVGGAGHALAIIKKGGLILGIDRDPEAIDSARKCLVSACPPGTFWGNLVPGNFADLGKIALSQKFNNLKGILFDLGISSHQVDTPGRGFSFLSPAPLDMRMDPALAVTAADLVNGLGRKELRSLFEKYAEEKRSAVVVEAICRQRQQRPIRTCSELASLIAAHYRPRPGSKIHPATRFFQALRIAVNDEINNLRQALPQAVSLLAPGGRLLVISFHRLEARVVKEFFKEESLARHLQIITKKPVTPSLKEIQANPRSRSAELRVAEKI